MSTKSFSKEFIADTPESAERLYAILTKKTTPRPINKELASPEVMARGRELLRQSLSR
jgi:hypothetical protein